MKLMKWIVAVVLLSSLTPSALCVTNGLPDNNGHPEVGTIVAEYKTPGVRDQACTGTLISPTVFLTAGHCINLLQQRGVNQVWVTFDPVFGPSVTLYPGKMYLNPNFPGHAPNGIDDYDIGVIVLESPITDIAPAQLPSLGLLDNLFAAGALRSMLFTVVGYGATDTVFGGGAPDTTQGKGTRRYATEGFLALPHTLLKLNMNQQFGYGGGSTGDSGAPNFFGAGSSETDILAGMTVLGDPLGIEQNIEYRLDTPEARGFLVQFVTLP